MINSLGISTQTDDVAHGHMTLSGVVTTPIVSASTPMKLGGTTSASSLFRMESPLSNRFVYKGLKSRTFTATASLSVTCSGTNKVFRFYFAKNGVVLSETMQQTKLVNGSDIQSVSLSGLVNLVPNDYVEIWVENVTSGNDITAESISFSVR